MEIGRTTYININSDPQLELSESYYMTKENRTFNLFFDSIRTSVVLRFRGAASTNIGSICIR